MKPWLLIATVLVLVAAGGYGVYHLTQDEASDGAPAGGVVDPSEAEQAVLRDIRKSSGWVGDPGFDEAAVREYLAAKKVVLDPADEPRVLALARAHLEALRANLEAAHEAAAAGTPASRRARYVAVAAAANREFQDAVRNVLPAETAAALIGALPSMVPPPPAD